jgi:hypothetical protein
MWRPGARSRRRETLVPPGVWGLVKSVLFHSLHLGITVLLTLLFTLFNSNLGPAALGIPTSPQSCRVYIFTV